MKALKECDLTEDFIFILIHVMNETPCPTLINKELGDNVEKKDLFYCVAPIISFLIIFFIQTDDKSKPKSLDDLITKSGLKKLIN